MKSYLYGRMRKDFGAKMSQKLVKSEVKIKQKLVESGEKISLFGSVFGDQCYTEVTLTTSDFFLHIYFHRPRRFVLCSKL